MALDRRQPEQVDKPDDHSRPRHESAATIRQPERPTVEISGRQPVAQLRTHLRETGAHADPVGRGGNVARRRRHRRQPLLRRLLLPCPARREHPLDGQHRADRLRQPACRTPPDRGRPQTHLPQQRLRHPDRQERRRRCVSRREPQDDRHGVPPAHPGPICRLRHHLRQMVGACRRPHGTHVERRRRGRHRPGRLLLCEPAVQRGSLPEPHLHTSGQPQPFALLHATAPAAGHLHALPP